MSTLPCWIAQTCKTKLIKKKKNQRVPSNMSGMTMERVRERRGENRIKIFHLLSIFIFIYVKYYLNLKI